MKNKTITGFAFSNEGRIKKWFKNPLDAFDYIDESFYTIKVEEGGFVESEDTFSIKESCIFKAVEIKPDVIKMFALHCAKEALPVFKKEFRNDKRLGRTVKAMQDFLELNHNSEKWLYLLETATSLSVAIESKEYNFKNLKDPARFAMFVIQFSMKSVKATNLGAISSRASSAVEFLATSKLDSEAEAKERQKLNAKFKELIEASIKG